MTEEQSLLSWDFDSAISLLHSLSLSKNKPTSIASAEKPSPQVNDDTEDNGVSLGDFSSIWDYLGRPRISTEDGNTNIVTYEINDVPVAEFDTAHPNKGVRWRDEVDGADLEDNVEPAKTSAANLRTQKRAARRTRARLRAEELAGKLQPTSDTGTDLESGEELESLRRSPDRRAVIDGILGRVRPGALDSNSPPTSPSPPKAEPRTPIKKDYPVSNPFLWTPTSVQSLPHRSSITPRDGLTPRARKQRLISNLTEKFPDEKKYLQNSGLIEPAFTPLNISNIGIHCFIDISNITIGFHDCLKMARDLSRESRVRRVPLNFHNFSLVLERGRPAAKRVLVGSDKYPAIQQAKSIGYETNILERVHKAKELTPRQKKFNSRSGGETSGSETTAAVNRPVEKWVEQAVDEILHLKILESLIDADKPGTIVLATGDAAEAEYSGGFMRMVERALEKGWMVELVSFKLNTSSSYKRRDFRSKWGPMFKWIQLDDFAELLIDEEEY